MPTTKAQLAHITRFSAFRSSEEMNSPAMAPTDHFLLEQYNALRTEVDHTIEQARRLLFWTVVGSGIVWSWTFTHYADAEPPLKFVQLFSPAVLTCFCWCYGSALDVVLTSLRAHLFKIEGKLLAKGDVMLGYEHACAQGREKDGKTRSRLGEVSTGIHRLLVAANFAAALYVWWVG